MKIPSKILKPDTGMFRRILLLIAIFGIAAFLVLFWKLYQIQVRDGGKYAQLAAEQQTREKTVLGSRGKIYDTEGSIMAISAVSYNVFISPFEILREGESAEDISKGLSDILGVPYEDIISHMARESSWYEMIKTGVDADTADSVTAFKTKGKYVGIHLETGATRYYPNGSLACHVLGYVGAEGHGLDGVELLYNDYLEGSNGTTVSFAPRGQYGIAYNESGAKNGCDVTLTINAQMQKIADKYLLQAINEYEVTNGGCCILLDVNTGAVRALASYNNFDPNDYLKISDEAQAAADLLTGEDRDKAIAAARFRQWRNKAVSDTYEPGSVFKTVTLSMGIEEGAANLSTTFDCGGEMSVPGRTTLLHCWDRGGHGLLTLAEAVQQSCNISFTKLGMSIGARRFYQYVEAFGFFEKTGIDLPGEARRGIWWSEKVFYEEGNLSQLAAASFGQTFTITPIQMVTALCAEVNGGNLLEPHVVEKITDPDGNTVYAHGTKVVRQVLSSTTSETVSYLVGLAVSEESATGHSAYIEGYNIAGKTGTSEKIETIQEDGSKDYVVSFGGWAPSDDPQLAIIFMLDTPGQETGTSVGGGSMAAPYGAKVLKESLDILGYVPHEANK